MIYSLDEQMLPVLKIQECRQKIKCWPLCSPGSDKSSTFLYIKEIFILKHIRINPIEILEKYNKI